MKNTTDALSNDTIVAATSKTLCRSRYFRSLACNFSDTFCLFIFIVNNAKQNQASLYLTKLHGTTSLLAFILNKPQIRVALHDEY